MYTQNPQQVVVQQTVQKPKKSGAMIAAMLFSIFAMVLIIVSLFTPWWAAHYSLKIGQSETTMDLSFKVQEVSSTSSSLILGNSTETMQKYNDDFKSNHNGANSAVAGLFSTEYTMTIVSVIFALLGIIFCFLALIGKIKPTIAGLIVMIAAIIALVTVLMLYANLPGAWETDYKTMNQTNPFPGFGGSSSSSNILGSTTTTWGPTTGWYIIMIGMIFLFIAASLAFSSKQTNPAPTNTVISQQPPVMVVQQNQYAPAQAPPPQFPPPPQQYQQPPQQYPPYQ